MEPNGLSENLEKLVPAGPAVAHIIATRAPVGANKKVLTLHYHLRVGIFHPEGVWWVEIGSALLAGKRLLWWEDGARAPRQTRARHQVGAIFGN